ncbi:H-NS histone family protein [Sulfitobacter sp. M22]|uniref:H-NS histone family protein n=1 Tax=Sulfitobacter sp. M22 TaxID=2675332 RepID=UPI001F2EF081|nr:H-NS histone family protein [Sulfitobacter sp. M22]MCF7728680.1 H-NS histone family protein [Sulfitobacter sp. M22]
MTKILSTEELSTWSLKELDELIANAQKARTKAEEQARKDLMQEMKDLASKHGLSINEVFGKETVRRSSLPAKYRHPENRSKTWTGQGRKPNWFKDYLENGGQKSDLEI